MHSSDSAFFDAYKKLERICSDRYAEQSGVSAYIADMEARAARGRAAVPTWNADYQGLKHIRWVRNRIAHEAESGRLSEADDLAFAQDFYRRLLAEKDPLTLLRKAGPQRRAAAPKGKKEEESSPQPRTVRAAPVLALIGCILLLLLLFYLICMNYR